MYFLLELIHQNLLKSFVELLQIFYKLNTEMHAPILLLISCLLFAGHCVDQLPAGCYQSNYTSTFTNCDMTFIFCHNYFQLKECVLRKCQRFIRASDCRLWTNFIQDEQLCYKNCCGASQFDQQQCDQFNIASRSRQQSASTGLTIALSITSVGLITVIVLFLVKRLRCCDKEDPFLILRFNVKWKKVVYEDNKCEICRTFGAFLTTPCHHNFHQSCFEENTKQMNCPKCGEKIRQRIRIFCLLCRQKAFKVKIQRLKDIEDAIKQGKALHVHQCLRQPRIGTHQTLKE